MEKNISRAAIERQPVDHVFMRRLVTRTVTDIAADLWQEVRNNNPNINWADIQGAFRERFNKFCRRSTIFANFDEIEAGAKTNAVCIRTENN